MSSCYFSICNREKLGRDILEFKHTFPSSEFNSKKNNASVAFIFRILYSCANEVGEIHYFCMHIKARNGTS